jgi:TonB-dependent SusC/RagA subfamily outer membrane receptor
MGQRSYTVVPAHSGEDQTVSTSSAGQPVKKQGAAAHVTLVVHDSTIAYIVHELARQAKLQVLYTMDNPVFSKRVTVRIVDMNIVDAMATALKGTGLQAIFTPDDKTVVLRTRSDSVVAEPEHTGAIIGSVTDSASNKGLAGATVSVLGSKISVLTKDNGSFVLPKVPVGKQSVTVKLIGYKSLSQNVIVVNNSRVTMHVVLIPTATVLSGVVTTVTGVQQRLAVGNDITTINVDSVMKTAPITSVTDLLETRVPGLTVQRTSGVPGAPSRIRLRGIGGGLLPNGEGASNDPIVVIDGIRIYANQSTPVDQNLAPTSSSALRNGQASYSSDYPPPSALDQIDPNSIETIEVLKGPSAAAMYGSDAANGVIVITTKHGQAGHTYYSLRLGSSIQYMPGVYAAPGYYPFLYPILNSAAGTATPCTIQMTGCVPPFLDSLVRFQALDDSRLSTIGRGSSNNASLTVSGGSNALTYSFTGSGTTTLGLTKMPLLYQDTYRDLYGATPPQWMRRPDRYTTWGMQANFVAVPTSNLRVTLMTSLTNSAQQQSSANLTLSSLASSYIDTTAIAPYTIGGYATRIQSKSTVANTAMSFAWTAWRILPLSGTLGISTNDRQDKKLEPYGIVQPFTNGTSTSNGDSVGFFSAGRGTSVTKSGTLSGSLFPTGRITTAVGLQVTQISQNIFQGASDSLAPGVSVPSTFSVAGL